MWSKQVFCQQEVKWEEDTSVRCEEWSQNEGQLIWGCRTLHTAAFSCLLGWPLCWSWTKVKELPDQFKCSLCKEGRQLWLSSAALAIILHTRRCRQTWAAWVEALSWEEWAETSELCGWVQSSELMKPTVRMCKHSQFSPGLFCLLGFTAG